MTYYKPRKYLSPEMYQPWGGLFMPKRYEVLNKRTWVTAYRAQVVGKSLHYILYDHTEGVAKEGTWRVAGEPVVKPTKPTMTNAIAGETQLLPDTRTRGVRNNPEDDNILDI